MCRAADGAELRGPSEGCRREPFCLGKGYALVALLSESSPSEIVAKLDSGKERVVTNIYLGISTVTRSVGMTSNQGQHMANSNG